MKKLLSLLFVFIPFLLLSFFVFPTVARASSYGDGAYGECTYGGNCATTTSSVTSSVSNAVSSATNTIAAFFCTNQAPSSAPNLYEIDTTGNTAKLFFSPAQNPYDSYFVSFGAGNNSEGNGAEFDQGQSKGAITYTVKQLSPSTTYTFKVRAGNGCKPGSWSSNLTVKTQPKGSKKIAKFTPKNQATYVVAKKQPAANWLSRLWTKPTATPAPTKKQTEVMGAQAPAPEVESKPEAAPSIWDTIGGFFKGIFRF